MTKLEHKDGSTVKLGFTYALTAGGQITRITHQDNAYWAYANDGCGRLTKAERFNASSVLQMRQTYSYDSGDNLLTKIEHDARQAPVITKNTWYRYNTANELTKMTVDGTDTNMTYDDWGRLATKTQGGYQATYQYHYGHYLKIVTTNFPGETTTSYLTDSLGKRRAKFVIPNINNPATWTVSTYRWDLGWNVVSDATTGWDIGARTKTLVHAGMSTLAEIDGTNPSTGTPRYYAHDHLGSARALYSSAKAQLGATEHMPYGDTYASTGTQPAYTFTGKPYDASVGLYYFPYRYYGPGMARWITRDPLGMVDGPNVYGYVRGGVVSAGDPLGLTCVTKRMHVTSYYGPGTCMDGSCTAPGVVAVGRKPKPDGTLGKEPVYPMDSTVTVDCNSNSSDVPDYVGTVHDTGRGNVVHNRNWPADQWIDVWYPTYEESRNWGNKECTVTICWDEC